MNISDAQEFLASFSAVMDGTATDAQCSEVVAAGHALGSYIREAVDRAKAIPETRERFLALLSPERRLEAERILAPNDTVPRIVLDRATGEVVTPDELKARQQERTEADPMSR